MQRACLRCGKVFQVEPSRVKIGKGKYCSTECAHEALKRRIKVRCLYCNKEFETVPSSIREGEGKFCSASCRAKYVGQRRTISHSEIRQCLICGGVFKAKNANIEKGWGKYCSHKCANEAKKKRKKKICAICGKEFEVIAAREEKARYCSIKCQRERSKTKLRCMICGKEFYVSPSVAGTRKTCSWGCELKRRKIPKETAHWEGGRKKAICVICGREFEYWPYMKGICCSKRCSLQLLYKNQQKRPTKLEKRIIDIIEKNRYPFKYVGDGTVVIAGLNPDFISTDISKKIIEVFGDIFHDTEKAIRHINWKRTEFGRKAVFSQLGFQTLVLWESDMAKMDDDEIKKQIEDFIRGERKE
jgi:hypothetical protein